MWQLGEIRKSFTPTDKHIEIILKKKNLDTSSIGCENDMTSLRWLVMVKAAGAEMQTELGYTRGPSCRGVNHRSQVRLRGQVQIKNCHFWNQSVNAGFLSYKMHHSTAVPKTIRLLHPFSF